MNSIRIVSQRALYAVAAFAMVTAMVVPAIVSAAQVTLRSVELSSSSVSATNVSYNVNFTTVGSAGAFVVDFCSNTPLIGQACTAPSGFTSSGVTTSTGSFSIDSTTANRVVVDGTLTADTAISVQLDGLTNPDAAGALYARIVTFDNATNAAASTPQVLGAGAVDDGAVAISITDTIGVSGTVLETLTFCVAGAAIEANCTNITEGPVLELGEQTGDVVALTPGVVSTGSIFTQVSTNADGGAVVRLKSNATDCGGLLRAGSPGACDISPALNSDITGGANEAKFGVKTATATATSGVPNASGTLAPVSGSFYNNSTYALNYISGNATGITSTFGDPFLDTADAPANNQNMELTFGATINNETPAGTYSADLSLIAVGKF
jgi:hypothetical protein